MKNKMSSVYLQTLEACVGYAVKFMLNLFLARHLVASMYGDLALALKLLNIMAVLTLFGTNIGSNRFFAKYLQTGKKDAAESYMAWNIKLLSITFLISIVIALIAFGVMSGLHYFGVHHIERYHLSVYMIWLVPLAGICMILCSYLLSCDQALLSSFYKTILKYLLQLVLFILFVLIIGPIKSNVSIISIILAAFLALIFLSLFTMRKDIYSMLAKGVKEIKGTRLKKGKWFLTNSRLIGNNIFLTLVCTIDLLAVEFCSSREADVGFYAAALSIVGFIWLMPQGSYRSLRPKMAALLSQPKKHNILQRQINQTNAINAAFIFLVMSLIIVFEKPILLLFGPSYTAAEYIVSILALGTLLPCLSKAAPLLLTLGGHEKKIFFLTSLELLVLIIFVFPVTYFYGLIGTAIVSAIVSTLKAIITVFWTRKLTGIRAATLL
jgi:O-antigen/teichoic acid export membrane protein